MGRLEDLNKEETISKVHWQLFSLAITKTLKKDIEMKIICSKEELVNSVNIVSKAVPSKTSMDILYCILIDASTPTIKMTANDMEMAIETITEGKVEEKGIIALDARLFSEIIRKLPDSEVTIVSDDRMNVTITCEQAVFNIVSKDWEEFTGIPVIEKSEPVLMTQFNLKEIIRQTIFSISANDSNQLMTGELFEIKNNCLSVTSLDGHRISIRRLAFETDYEDRKVIVPGKTLNEISKILSGETADVVSIYFSKNHIMFEFDKTVVVSRLIEGNYFRVDHMISSDYETLVKVNRRELMDCIDRSILLTREDDKRPLVFDIQENNLYMAIRSGMGTMDENISIERLGKDMKIGFNPRYLLDALRVIDDEEIQMYMVNAKAPCFIRNEKETYLYVILPVNFAS